jgi:hypothetical protein
MKKANLLWWKLVAVWVLFLALHFSYETFPNTVFQIIGEDGETTFFHMKMLFFAYLAVSLVELALRRKELTSLSAFSYQQALIAVAYPWLTITMWFSAEALGFRMPNPTAEIIYANIFTVLGIYLALRLEEALAGVEFRVSTKVMIVLVFVCALLSYISFSFNAPMPFFTTPPGI